MDRYDFASVVDDIFKECKTIEEACARYSQLKDDLDNLFKQNMTLIAMKIENGSTEPQKINHDSLCETETYRVGGMEE